MRVSLITTVRNEEATIQKLLDSVKNQTTKPDEFIIVDGGSTDRTIEIIKNSKIKTRLIIKKGNRSVGRNAAIKDSTHDIIACTDAGCVLDSRWLERISKPFNKKNIDVVAGFYIAKTSSVFEKCLATYTSVMPDKFDEHTYLPSSRSIAFRKSAWKKVNGYPENLDTCEDLVFAKKLKVEGLKFITVKNAIVYWPQRKNILEAGKQFFSYAKGDGRARYFRSTTPLLFGRYVIGISLLIYILIHKNYSLLLILYCLLVLYIYWSIYKNYKYVKHWRGFFYLPLLQFTADAMVMAGVVYGLFYRPNV